MKKLLGATLALVVTLACASPFLVEIPPDPPEEEASLIFVDVPAGHLLKNEDGVFKMMRIKAAWTDRAEPIVHGIVVSEFAEVQQGGVSYSIRDMTYYCKPGTVTQTSFTAYNKELKKLQDLQNMSLALTIIPNTPAVIEINFMCEGLPPKTCTAKDCI